MKTGQMLFVAFGGIMLGAAGTLAIQTGLVHYEVTLDIRPRGTVTLPPPTLSAANDPYLAPPVQNWEPAHLKSRSIQWRCPSQFAQAHSPRSTTSPHPKQSVSSLQARAQAPLSRQL